MKALLKTLSYIGLALTLIPSFLVFLGLISFELNKILMIIGSICWFVTAPYWMNDKSAAEALEEDSRLKTQ